MGGRWVRRRGEGGVEKLSAEEQMRERQWRRGQG